MDSVLRTIQLIISIFQILSTVLHFHNKSFDLPHRQSQFFSVSGNKHIKGQPHQGVRPHFRSREDLLNLPAAIICTAENDSLRAERARYADMLRGAGISVSLSNASGMPHGYFEYCFGDAATADFLAFNALISL